MDNQFEKTTQTVEIALRYFLTENPGIDFIKVFLYIHVMDWTHIALVVGLAWWGAD